MPIYRGMYYTKNGCGEPILLLHGWGANSDIWRPILYDLEQNFTVYCVDFWGFGKSEKPLINADIFSYANVIEQFIRNIICAPTNILGHSFGGRVALILGQSKLVKKIILVDSAGLKPKFSLKKYYLIKKYKRQKRIVAQGKASKESLEKFGSVDYQSLNDLMKGVFVRVVNQDLARFAGAINKPTLIIWGDKDITTPIYMAKRLHKMIKNSILVIINGGHFSFIDDTNQFLRACYQFLLN